MKPSGMTSDKTTSAIAKQRSARLHRFQSAIQSCTAVSPVLPKFCLTERRGKISAELWLHGVKGSVNLPQIFTVAMERERMYDPYRVKSMQRPPGLAFKIGKIGHVVLNVRDVERSARFYIELLGLEISDAYPEEMVPGGMVFLRCNPDHHGIALVGSTAEAATNSDLNHIAFEVATLDEVLRARDHLTAAWRRDRLCRPPPSRLPDRGRISRP